MKNVQIMVKFVLQENIRSTKRNIKKKSPEKNKKQFTQMFDIKSAF